MKARKSVREFRYNEPKPKPPPHHHPKGNELELRQFPGAGARITVERLAESLVGIDDGFLRLLGISNRDIVEHRDAIRDALLSILREGPNANPPKVRGIAVAYLGELRMEETVDVLSGLGSSPAESPHVRGLAAEALCRIGNRRAVASLCNMLADPDPVVRKRSVKALGIAGGPNEGRLVAALASGDADAEVRYQAGLAARKLLPRNQHARLPTPQKRARARKTRSVIAEENIVRSIGRHTGAPPQTLHTHGNGDGTAKGFKGGIDHIAMLHQPPAACGVVFQSQGYAFDSDHAHLRIFGPNPGTVRSGPTQDLAKVEGAPGAIRSQYQIFVGTDGTKTLRLRSAHDLRPGWSLPFVYENDECGARTPTFVPGINPAPVITEVSTDVPVIWLRQNFDFSVRFVTPGLQRPVWLKVATKFPKDDWQTRWFIVSKAEQAAGVCTAKGFRCAETGTIEVDIRMYGECGGACSVQARYECLPANPHSVSVVPSTTGTNGEGPAHYNSGEDRFYCYARCTVSNGNANSITVGPTVTCRATDGGTETDEFDFSIGTWTVPAQSSIVLNLWTSFPDGTDTYDVFEDFGDVTLRFTFQSSNGSIADSSVWAAMAKVNLALNFVGSMTSTDRANFQSICETEASAIYEQQSLYIDETQRFLLPSSDSDWNRFRDIEMNDNKASDCTAGSDEADDLRDDWSSSTDWLDVWIVESFSGPACAASVGGFSPVDGPTGKGGSKSGVVVQLAGVNMTTTSGRNLMGIIVAHEVGHFLGLDHDASSANFMAASTGGTNTAITHAQYLEMAEHGFVERFVP
jgi:HEAT repeats